MIENASLRANFEKPTAFMLGDFGQRKVESITSYNTQLYEGYKD